MAEDGARPQNVLSPVFAAGALIAVSVLLCVTASRAAAGFLPSLDIRHPVLAKQKLAPPPRRAGPRLSRRVILVIIDGLRLEDSYGRPFLDSLRTAGIDASARSLYPTVSYANYTSIATGVPPVWSGVRNNYVKWTVDVDSIMARAKAAGMTSAFVGDYSAGFAYMYHDELDDVHYTPWHRGGFVKAAKLVIRRGYPLVVLLPGLVDEMGHAHGGDSREYRAAVDTVDHMLKNALAGVDLSRDTVIVTADHGHTDQGGHGGLEPEVVHVPLIMAGAGVRAGAALLGVKLTDIAPTIAALLGIPPPIDALGRTLTEALAVPASARARLAAADAARISRNRAVVEKSAERARGEVARSRVRRLLLIGALLALAVALIFLGRRLGALHIDWRVLAIAVPAFPITYYALLDMFGQHFSPSAIPPRSHALDHIIVFGLVSTCVHVVASWIALRGRVVLRDRLAAACALTMCGMFVSMFPAGVMWAVFDVKPFVELPGPSMLVLIPATYVAVACYALATAATLSLETVIFFARAVDPRMRPRRLPPERRADKNEGWVRK